MGNNRKMFRVDATYPASMFLLEKTEVRGMKSLKRSRSSHSSATA